MYIFTGKVEHFGSVNHFPADYVALPSANLCDNFKVK